MTGKLKRRNSVELLGKELQSIEIAVKKNKKRVRYSNDNNYLEMEMRIKREDTLQII